MNRQQFVALLRRLRALNLITPEQGADFLSRWDSGEISVEDLPIEYSEMIQPVNDRDMEEALAALKESGVTL